MFCFHLAELLCPYSIVFAATMH